MSVTSRWIGMDLLIANLRNTQQFLADLDAVVLFQANIALESVKRLTPRSARRYSPSTTAAAAREQYHGPHAADLWELKKLGPARYVIDHPFNHVTEFFGRAVNDLNFNLLLSLEYGTGPHSIDPKEQEYLTFWHEGDQKWIRTSGVFHPGTQPYGMVRRSAELVRGPLYAVVEKALEERFRVL